MHGHDEVDQNMDQKVVDAGSGRGMCAKPTGAALLGRGDELEAVRSQTVHAMMKVK